jgi:hypothetical protein
MWSDRWCSGLIRLQEVRNFVCPGCVRIVESEGEEEIDSFEVEGARLAEVEYFCHLGDVLDCEAGQEMTVRAKVAAAWSSLREVSSLLLNRGMPVMIRGGVYVACIRYVTTYVVWNEVMGADSQTAELPKEL